MFRPFAGPAPVPDPASSSASRPRSVLAVALLLFVSVLATPGAALAIDPVYSNWRGLAIRGADPVAYFTEGKHVEGSSKFSLEYAEATWRFASAENKARFEANPDRYVPQFGGYCAWAVSQGHTASVDPDVWSIVEGKLYLNYNQDVMKKWLANRDAFIEQAEANWPGLRDG